MINLFKTFSTLHICFLIIIKIYLKVTIFGYIVVTVYILRGG